MNIEILIADGPLRMEPLTIDGCGAVARFEGIVRGIENNRAIEGLSYETYGPMAEKIIRAILEELHSAHPFASARVHHRVGFVSVGEAAIIMEVHSRHRAEAFAVLQTFMDRLKKDVPIWKRNPR
jgi:molybdopterin synthase catalytic subunit